MLSPAQSNPRLRRDLICRPIEMRGESMWVIKDPLGRDYFQISNREYRLLNLVDGSRSLDEMVAYCANAFTPDIVLPDQIQNFLAELRRRGFLANHDDQNVEIKGSTSRWWSNPFAIRFPGIAVDRLLDPMMPILQLFASVPLLIFGFAMMIVGFITALFYSAEIASHISSIAMRSVANWGMLLFVTLTFTKVIHELAHAVSCKWFGASCREIGIMLLFGMPVLYCDVSDAWLIRERWKRVVVSTAGMMVECFIASIAVFLWLTIEDSTARDLCVSVIVVCSISTLVFNGNPLLRYDGYYMLSDAMGIANLSQRATTSMQCWVRKWLWGEPAQETQTGLNRFLRGYWFASTAYRIGIYVALGMFVYYLAERVKMGEVVGSLLVILEAIVLYRMIHSVCARPEHLRNRSMLTHPSFLIASGLGLIAVALTIILPAPTYITAAASIRPANAQTLFVTSPGRLDHAIEPVFLVSKGDVIARIVSPELESKRLMLHSNLNKNRTELSVLNSRRSLDTQSHLLIPTLSQKIQADEDQLNLIEREQSRLIVRSPRAGRIFPIYRTCSHSKDASHLQGWTHSPLDGENRDAWLESGTELCAIGDAQHNEAIVFVSQNEVERIRVGQPVRLQFAHRASNEVVGRVTEVATSPVIDIPQELISKGMLRSWDEGAAFYQVRVLLDPESSPLAVHMTCIAKIELVPEDIWTQAFRRLQQIL